MIGKLLFMLGAGALGYIASGGKKKVQTWFGSTAAMGSSSTEDTKIGSIIRMVIADPKVPGKFTTASGATFTYQPVAVADVKWVGNDTKNDAAIGQIVAVIAYELSTTGTAPRKPKVGDAVLFD